MDRKLKVSVVIPATEKSVHIKETLDSIKRSSLQPDEIVIVNDGASRDIQELELNYPIKVVNTSRKKGPAGARNLGVDRSSGDIIFFVDSDALIHPDAILRAVNILDQDSSFSGVSFTTSLNSMKDSFVSRYCAVMNSYYREEYLKGSSQDTIIAPVLTTRCCAIRQNVFSALGGFNENIRSAGIEDLEFSERMNMKYKVYGVMDCPVDHYWSTDILKVLYSYFIRSYEWAIWISGARKMPTVGGIVTSRKRFYSTLTGALALIFLVLGFLKFWFIVPGILFLIFHMVSNAYLYHYASEKVNFRFMGAALCITLINSFLIFSGTSIGLIARFFKRGNNH